MICLSFSDAEHPLDADYVGLLQGGMRLPFPDERQRFYDGLIECLLTEAQLVLTAQYFYGLKLDEPGMSAADFENFKQGKWEKLTISRETLAPIGPPEPVQAEELDEFILSGLDQFSFTELHARLFVDHYTTMIRAQWDKLVMLAGTTIQLTRDRDHISERLSDLKQKLDGTSEVQSSISRSHFNIFCQIASDRLRADGWLKRYRDTLLHKIGPRSSGLIPHRSTLYSTADSWLHAKEEHNWQREAIVSLLIALITAKGTPELST